MAHKLPATILSKFLHSVLIFCYTICMQYDGEELKEICKRNGISYLALFGSLARGEAGASSDADLLVNYSSDSPIRGLFAHLGVGQEFEKLFKRGIWKSYV